MSGRSVQYRFRQGFRAAGGLDPSAVAAELERVRAAEGGTVTPQAVVSAAADPASPMHPAFTWDDTEAARLRRLDEARRLIRAVVVEIPQREPMPVYIHVKEVPRLNQPRGYLPTTYVVRHADLYREAVAELKAKVAALQRSVDQVESLARTAERRQAAARLRGSIARTMEDLARAEGLDGPGAEAG
jgi:hypothetical protein